jgi:ubiquinone biosynthesis protein UbiJ
MKSSSSQRGLKDKVKKEEMEMFLMKVRTENAAATSDDVAVLKKQVQALEAKVDELQLIVRV